MTELEKIAYAKSFMDKLANGINPLDDTPIPEDDLANHVRLSRCFFYVSTILQKEIDRERRKLPKEKKSEKLPFSITPEQLSRFEYSPYPISVSAMGKKINWLVREEIEENRMEKFSYRKINYWLHDIGMIEWREWGKRGKSKRFPTEDGEAIGLVLQMWENYGRQSPIIYLSEEAQHFIIDHIEAIMVAEKGSVWYPEEEEAEEKLFSSITKQQLQGFEYAPDPISATELSRKINRFLSEKTDAKMAEGISYRKITQWLLNIGMIEYREWEDGTIKRFPTEEGESIGLVLNDFYNDGIKAPVIYFTEQAQEFVVDHIDHVVATKAKKGKTTYPWGVNDAQKIVVTENAPQADAVYDAPIELFKEPQKEEEEEQRLCRNCRFQQSGECSSWTPCDDFQAIYQVSQSEKDAWPTEGDATRFKQKWKRR